MVHHNYKFMYDAYFDKKIDWLVDQLTYWLLAPLNDLLVCIHLRPVESITTMKNHQLSPCQGTIIFDLELSADKLDNSQLNLLDVRTLEARRRRALSTYHSEIIHTVCKILTNILLIET